MPRIEIHANKTRNMMPERDVNSPSCCFPVLKLEVSSTLHLFLMCGAYMCGAVSLSGSFWVMYTM